MTNTQKSELLPCPFCGGSPALNSWREDGPPGQEYVFYEVACGYCEISPASCKDDEDKAIQQWNTRADGWQPIESAPKNRMILVCGGTYDWDESWNSEGVECKHVADVCWVDGIEPGWQGDNTGGHDIYFWYKPKYWMDKPLPKVDD